jgi:hypothetical protein
MLRLEPGKKYKLRDGGTIRVEGKHQTDTESVMRCVTETGEVVFYNERGWILPLDGGKELARYNVEGEARG